MQAVVKTPRIEISVRGAAIPPRLMDVLKEEYGPELSLVEDDGDDLVNVFETRWYKGVKEKMTPGIYLRIYRENKGLTQLQLGEVLGGIPRQHISNMEHGLIRTCFWNGSTIRRIVISARIELYFPGLLVKALKNFMLEILRRCNFAK